MATLMMTSTKVKPFLFSKTFIFYILAKYRLNEKYKCVYKNRSEGFGAIDERCTRDSVIKGATRRPYLPESLPPAVAERSIVRYSSERLKRPFGCAKVRPMNGKRISLSVWGAVVGGLCFLSHIHFIYIGKFEQAKRPI